MTVQVTPAVSVRDHGIYLEKQHVNEVARYPGSCARALASFDRFAVSDDRFQLPRSTLSTLISSFDMSKLDYCNVAVAGLPSCNLNSGVARIWRWGHRGSGNGSPPQGQSPWWVVREA